MTNGSSTLKQAAATIAIAADGNDGHRTNGTTLLVSDPLAQPNLKTTATTTSSTQLLSDPLDEGTLSSGFVLLRKQIEIFEATEEDVMARRKFGGIISVQQVGIRCTHCAHLPHIIPDQASAIETALENGNINAMSLLFQLRIFLTYLFGKYQVAGQLVTAMECFTAEENPNPSRELWASELLYKGLVAAALARNDDRARWMPTLLECRERLEEICVLSSRHRHSLKLLEAELAYTNGVKDVAARLYDEAIYFAKENGLLHQTALASERAAIFHSSALSNNEVLASSYRKQARGLYLQWGAYRKATTLVK